MYTVSFHFSLKWKELKIFTCNKESACFIMTVNFDIVRIQCLFDSIVAKQRSKPHEQRFALWHDVLFGSIRVRCCRNRFTKRCRLYNQRCLVSFTERCRLETARCRVATEQCRVSHTERCR